MAHGASHNWRQGFFYGVEIVYAIIIGLSEAYIYQLYQPQGLMSLVEAGARATITQIVLILFAVATIEIAKAAGGGMKSFMAVAGLNLILLPFSFVAFWFMREAAILFAHTGALAPLASYPLQLPFGITLRSSDIDVNLIASVTFFQVALTWIAPLIVRKQVPETAEERKARQDAEFEEANHKKRMAGVKAGGLGRSLKANWSAITAKSEEEIQQEDQAEAGDSVEIETEAPTPHQPGEIRPSELMKRLNWNARGPDRISSSHTVTNWLTDGAITAQTFLTARKDKNGHWWINTADVLALANSEFPQAHKIAERYAAWVKRRGHLTEVRKSA